MDGRVWSVSVRNDFAMTFIYLIRLLFEVNYEGQIVDFDVDMLMSTLSEIVINILNE